MSDETLSYPTDAMKQTAQEIRALLDEQWAKHMALFQTQPNSLTNLTTTLTDNIPGGKGQELQNQLAQWGKGISQCYQSLYAIADALENAADAMLDTDLMQQKMFQHVKQQ